VAVALESADNICCGWRAISLELNGVCLKAQAVRAVEQRREISGMTYLNYNLSLCFGIYLGACLIL
jgi:hypothetical protein